MLVPFGMAYFQGLCMLVLGGEFYYFLHSFFHYMVCGIYRMDGWMDEWMEEYSVDINAAFICILHA